MLRFCYISAPVGKSNFLSSRIIGVRILYVNIYVNFPLTYAVIFVKVEKTC